MTIAMSAPTAESGAPPPSSLQTSVSARTLGVLEEMPWLESLGQRIGALLQPISDQRSIMDVLHGRWLGHALHPVLSVSAATAVALVSRLVLTGGDLLTAAVAAGFTRRPGLPPGPGSADAGTAEDQGPASG